MFSVSAKNFEIFRFYFNKQLLRKDAHQHLLDGYLWTICTSNAVLKTQNQKIKHNLPHVLPSCLSFQDFSDLETKFVLNSVNVSPLDESAREIN